MTYCLDAVERWHGAPVTTLPRVSTLADWRTSDGGGARRAK